jgi:hypothetical protein
MWKFMFDDEVREEIRAYLNSHEWWMLWPLSESGNSAIGAIEARFYKDEASADLHLIIGPFGPVFFAKKSRMRRAELSEMINHPIPADGRDILSLIGTTGPEDVHLARINAFHEWIGPGVSGSLPEN